MNEASLPLAGIRVLDMGTLTPGKYCSYLLADLGATVTRVERPTSALSDAAALSDEDEVLNRNKRSIALDLKTPRGGKILAALCNNTDVLIEANRPGVAARLGYGAETLRARNPALVYCSLSAFGQTGPYRDRPAYDLVFMGMSGVWQALLGGQAPPAAPGLFLADAVTGLTAALGIVTACLKAHRTGEGAHLDLSMLEATTALLVTSHGLARSESKGSGVKVGPRTVPGSAPGYRCYKAQGESYLMLGAIRPASWRALKAAVGAEALGDNPYAGGAEGQTAIAALSRAFATAPAATWVERLTALDIDCGELREPGAVYDDPQLVARGMVTSVSPNSSAGPRHFLSSPLASSFARAHARAAPSPGADTEQILDELGIAAEGE